MVKSLVALLALSYVMPSYSILRRLSNRRDAIDVTRLELGGLATVGAPVAREVATQLGTEWSSGELRLTATAWVHFPGRCRVELSAADSTRTVAAVWAQGRARTEGGALPALEAATSALCGTLAVHSGTDGESRAAIERYLSSLKVETRQVRFARFSGDVAWVLGADGDGKAQLWVYKERYLPARVRTADGWDVRFVDYASQAAGDWWPRVVEVYRGAELQLRLTVLSADGKADLSHVTF